MTPGGSVKNGWTRTQTRAVGASAEHERAQGCGDWVSKDSDLHHNQLCPKRGDIISG